MGGVESSAAADLDNGIGRECSATGSDRTACDIINVALSLVLGFGWIGDPVNGEYVDGDIDGAAHHTKVTPLFSIKNGGTKGIGEGGYQTYGGGDQATFREVVKSRGFPVKIVHSSSHPDQRDNKQDRHVQVEDLSEGSD